MIQVEIQMVPSRSIVVQERYRHIHTHVYIYLYIYTHIYIHTHMYFLYVISIDAHTHFQVVKNPPASAADLRDLGLIPGLGRASGAGNGNPLQYSCVGNHMDRGAWWATVRGVTKSRTQLSTSTRVRVHIHTLCTDVSGPPRPGGKNILVLKIKN